jgi:O-antigen/teichoic acid export membrane protein
MQFKTMRDEFGLRYVSWLRTPFALRIVRGSLAQIYNQVVTIGVQLLSVPMLLHYWGAQQYGTWLILSAIPTYLTIADLGFAQIAANEMSVMVGAENRPAALATFQSIAVLVALFASLAVIGSALIVLVVPFSEIFNLSSVSNGTVQAVLVIFAFQFAISLYFGVIGAGLRADGQFAKMVFLTATSRLLEQIAVVLAAAVGAGVISASSSMLCVRAGITCIAALILLRNAPWLSFGVAHARFQIVKRLFLPSVTYTAYTLGYLVNIQGITLIVGAIFGPAVVANFSVMRTLARLGPTASNIINFSLEPEYSFIYGAGELRKYKWLARRHAYATAGLCIFYLAGMWLFAHWIIHAWTSDRVSPMEPLLTLIAIACACEMMWSSGQASLVSINRHKTVATFYLLLSCVSIVVMYVGAKVYGINAIGIVSVFVALCMIAITRLRLAKVLGHSLQQSGLDA